ncbi:MAG: replication initiator protein A [Aestuariivita sp.]|nr:replication initiator protein A [Aestuariivita sp.]
MSKTKSLPVLTPQRYLPNLFTLDVSSINIKDTQQQLEHPLFSLSKKPDIRPKEYQLDNGTKIEVLPNYLGRPTIWDKDLLIYAISSLRNRMEQGEEVSPRILFHTSDVIEFCQRTKGGSAYARIDKALTRLAGALIKTNVRTGGIETTKGFHIIEEYDIKRQYDKPDGRLIYCEFTLSDWLFRAVMSDQEILTLHPDYFRLRRALDRRLYEIARKHCGRQADWAISIEKLYNKCGSATLLADFRYCLRHIADGGGDLLEYDLAMRAGQRGQELVVFRRREGSYLKQHPSVHPPSEITLSHSVAVVARKQHGDTVDLNTAEQDWRAWMKRKNIRPVNPEAMFLSFLARWVAGQENTEHTPNGADPVPTPAPDWIEYLAQAWWESLDPPKKVYWRETIGQRVELGDGQGWFLTDHSIATLAFDQFICPRNNEPPESLPAAVIAAVAVKADVTLPESAYDQFSVFVRESIARKPFIAGVWRSLLLEMIKEFIQLPSFREDPSETVNKETNGIDPETLGLEVANWIQDAETFWKTLPDIARTAIENTIRTGPGPEIADGQGGWVPAPQGWIEPFLAQAGYAAAYPDKPRPHSLELRLPPGG